MDKYEQSEFFEAGVEQVDSHTQLGSGDIFNEKLLAYHQSRKVPDYPDEYFTGPISSDLLTEVQKLSARITVGFIKYKLPAGVFIFERIPKTELTTGKMQKERHRVLCASCGRGADLSWTVQISNLKRCQGCEAIKRFSTLSKQYCHRIRREKKEIVTLTPAFKKLGKKQSQQSIRVVRELGDGSYAPSVSMITLKKALRDGSIIGAKADGSKVRDAKNLALANTLQDALKKFDSKATVSYVGMEHPHVKTTTPGPYFKVSFRHKFRKTSNQDSVLKQASAEKLIKTEVDDLSLEAQAKKYGAKVLEVFPGAKEVAKEIRFENKYGYSIKRTITRAKEIHWGSKGMYLGESIMRTILRRVFPGEVGLPKTWVHLNQDEESQKNLTYDVAIERLKIAFEHQGNQHQKYVKHFHESLEQFEFRRSQDDLKKLRSAQAGWKLFQIDDYKGDVNKYLDAIIVILKDIKISFDEQRVRNLDTFFDELDYDAGEHGRELDRKARKRAKSSGHSIVKIDPPESLHSYSVLEYVCDICKKSKPRKVFVEGYGRYGQQYKGCRSCAMQQMGENLRRQKEEALKKFLSDNGFGIKKLSVERKSEDDAKEGKRDYLIAKCEFGHEKKIISVSSFVNELACKGHYSCKVCEEYRVLEQRAINFNFSVLALERRQLKGKSGPEIWVKCNKEGSPYHGLRPGPLCLPREPKVEQHEFKVTHTFLNTLEKNKSLGIEGETPTYCAFCAYGSIELESKNSTIHKRQRLFRERYPDGYYAQGSVDHTGTTPELFSCGRHFPSGEAHRLVAVSYTNLSKSHRRFTDSKKSDHSPFALEICVPCMLQDYGKLPASFTKTKRQFEDALYVIALLVRRRCGLEAAANRPTIISPVTNSDDFISTASAVEIDWGCGHSAQKIGSLGNYFNVGLDRLRYCPDCMRSADLSTPKWDEVHKMLDSKPVKNSS